MLARKPATIFTGFFGGGRGSVSDILLAVAVVGIIGMMLLPMPLWLLDALIAISILLSLSLVLLAIYIPNPSAFSSFPSVLLLATLFRLSLSISTTRLILLDADAGQLIDAFGQMVVGGNLVVGVVVFLIITVVQFIVVAKGAERVAEVAARFSLDAMPGKQLSIDSDLRSGLIDKDEARRKRRSLSLETQLHGSMDGAMKFVKGDAIAGIVIVIINILAGLAIGVLQRDMAIGDAMHTYSILTIGDGLVAQVPALLSAIAAGLIITRTESEFKAKHLGEAIGRQVLSQPRVLVIGAILALLLTLVPGFPWAVFLVLGLGLLAGYVWVQRAGVLGQRLGLPKPVADLGEAGEPDAPVSHELLPPPAVILRVAPDVAESLGKAELTASSSQLMARLQDRFGVPLPAPVVRVDAGMVTGGYRLEAHGVPLVDSTLEQPALLRLPNPHQPGLTDPKVVSINASEGQKEAAPASRSLECCLENAIVRQLGLFIGIQETSNLLNEWNNTYPDLIREMMRVVAPQRITEVLKRMVHEQLPIRNLRYLFEALVASGEREHDVVALTEKVRMAMRRQLSDYYTGPDRQLCAVLAHPQLEETIRQSIRQGGGNQVAMDPDVFRRVRDNLVALLAPLAPGAALLCSPDVRRHLRCLLEEEFFEIPVLSYQELMADIKVTPAGQLNA